MEPSGIRFIKKEDELSQSVQYWATKTPAERVEAVTQLRMQWVHHFGKQKEYNESRSALRRVHSFIKRS
ncbi:MAG: hypothetical protein AAFW89_07080 [Bacteroidota bacterium]